MVRNTLAFLRSAAAKAANGVQSAVTKGYENAYGVSTILAAGAFSAKPNTSIPGSDTGVKLVGGLMTFGQIAAVGGLVLGAMLWMFGSRQHNSQHASAGKAMLFAGVAGAFMVGAANDFGSSAFKLGGEVD